MFQAVRIHGKRNPDGTARAWESGQELPGENLEQDGASVKASEKADYYERKAEAAENNNAIYLDDDNAVEKLERKLAELVKAQEDMKAANKVVKNKKLTEEEKKVRLMELGYSETSAVELLTPCYGHIGFPSFSLSNNNANIRRVRQRIEELSSRSEFAGWTFPGGDAKSTRLKTVCSLFLRKSPMPISGRN